MKTALLLSGGMDSICLAWWKRPEVAYTVDYGQLPAAAEIAASAAVCRALGIEHRVLSVNARPFGSGDMSGTPPHALAPASDWWPFRNQFLITLVGMHAVSRGIQRLLLGTVSSDGSHRDGTSQFIGNMNILMSQQEGELKVEAPAIGLETQEVVEESALPMSILSWAHSCHRADVACGACRGCNKYFAVLEALRFSPNAVTRNPKTKA